tara:strand:- start:231 stop:1124 length:894 start_codon:yes stop_codon:yes gene_type:complete
MKQTILITGSTGFLGRHLVQKLNQLDYNIIEINSTNFSKIWELEKNSINFIIHLAVKTAAGGYCKTHPGEQWIINNNINSEILTYWLNNQPNSHMITFGSSCSYNADVIKSENNYLKGEVEEGYEVYGNLKRNLLVGLKALNQEFGMTYNYFIPSVFYGPDYDLTDKHFIFDLIRKITNAKNGGAPVVLWGDGTQERELIYISDAVDIIIQSITNKDTIKNICNLSSGNIYSLKTYAKTICNIVDYDYNLIKWNSNAFVGAKSKKLINTYFKNFKFIDLKLGLNKTISYYINKLEEK